MTELNFDGGVALLVVDMQNDFCHPDGSLYAEGSEDVIPQVIELMHAFYEDEDNHRRIFTRDTHDPDADEFDKWGKHCVEGSWGHRIHPFIAQERQLTFTERVVDKSTYDTFRGTDLARNIVDGDYPSEPDTLVICGTLANVCVQETAATANLEGYDVVVAEDAVGYISEEQRDRALDHIDFLIGETATVDEIVEAL